MVEELIYLFKRKKFNISENRTDSLRSEPILARDLY